MARILVIEDEPDIQAVLRFTLSKDGHQVTVSGNGGDGLQQLRQSGADLVLLDLMLPDRDGLEICRIIRADPILAATPIIMVTAKGEESDVVVGLGLGADDYVTKPFRTKELLARVKVRLQRARDEAQRGDRRPIQVSGLNVNPVSHRATVDGVEAGLTLTEFKLLQHLASHPGVAYDRDQLIDHLGDGESAITDRTIDVHVRNLRAKIRPYDHLIETVRGVGYRFADSGEQ